MNPIINNYSISQKLGTDALGVNYRAEGPINKSQILLTQVYPFLSANPNIWKKINILLEGVQKSNIPNLYSPVEIIHREKNALLIYPHLEYKTLEQVLEESHKQNKPINLDLAFSLAVCIADLLDVGTSIRISGEKSFHGLLTPDNILTNMDGKIFLKNYGIYPYINREETVFNEIVEKYGRRLAPEFHRKEKLVAQTDIYYLGRILYKILTGKDFYSSPQENFERKLSAISFSPLVPPPDRTLFTNIVTFFKKTLHPVPSQRFHNLNQFKNDIVNNVPVVDLSSFTFQWAYFMNSLYLEAVETQKETAHYATPPQPQTYEPQNTVSQKTNPMNVPRQHPPDKINKELFFISYSRTDEDFVLPLCKKLKEEGVAVWLDQWEIAPGKNWNRSIDEALDKSTRMLLILSPEAVDSDEVLSELYFFLDEKKPVFPLRYRDCRIPRRLNVIQHIPFTSPDLRVKTKISELVKIITQ